MIEAGDYWSRVNPDLLKLIPLDARTVLEVGCGAGALAEAYRRRNPGVRWLGIEANADAAQSARSRGLEVIDTDVEQLVADTWRPARTFCPSPAVDCLIIGDVLEHLRDPWATLERAAEWLEWDGLCLACIPNVRHYSMALKLLKGGWAYQDEGLLDKTHLRFFDLAGIKAMFAGAGLDVFEVRARQCGFNPAEFAEFAGMLNPLALTDELKRQAKVFQWVVRARKPDGAVEGNFAKGGAPIRIHALEAEACCARPRLREPLEAMAAIPGIRLTDKDPHITIIQRDRQATVERYRGLLAGGSLLIADVDDHPEFLVGMERGDFLALRACHAVTVSTEPLAEVCRRWNPNVFVVPNQILEVPPLAGPIMDHQVSVFCGWQNRREAWEPILPALNRVAEECSKRLEFQVVHDREFFDALEAPDKTFHPFLEYAAYRKLLGSCDIAILPLADTPFDRVKSDLKFLEAAAEGVAVLASRVAFDQATSYDTIVYQPGPMMEYWSDVLPFGVQLENLVRNADRRRFLAENAHRYVTEHRMLRNHYRNHYDLYRSLLARKAKLDASLRERCPEMTEVPA